VERVKPEIQSKIYENLKELIEKAGNVTAFARSIGVSRDTVNNWRFGKSDIRLNDLVTISQTYNVSVDYLLGLAYSPTREGNKQAAEEYFKLSPGAVDVLHKLKSYTDYVSAMIESPNFESYVYQMERFENRIYSCEQEISIIQENGISDGKPVTLAELKDSSYRAELDKRSKGSYAVSRLYTELALLQVSLFELSRIHSSVIESVFPHEKTIANGQEILKKCGVEV
jgi:transcriptional regulator with XRE-family HTH domain